MVEEFVKLKLVEAKKDVTRATRVAKAIEMLSQGKKLV